MTTTYSVTVANPQFRGVFDDVIRATEAALRALGRWGEGGRLIVFGAAPRNNVPSDAIIYEAEQLGRGSSASPFYKDHVVWTFCDFIAEGLRERGAKRLVTCPIGYVPAMTRGLAAPEEDIDVLFYGSMNDRRRWILDELVKTRLTVVCKNAFGAERDALIARSKVVLNLHYYDPAVFEIFRVSHLLANKKAVVCEGGGRDPALEALAASCTSLVSRERLVDECLRLVSDEPARAALADKGFQTFCQLDFVKSVAAAIAQTEAFV